MTQETIDIGSTVRIYGSIRVDGVLTDPSTLTLTITTPSAVQTVYTYGTDPEIIRDAVGKYHLDLQISESGTWVWEWFANSELNAADSGTIVTSESYTFDVLNEDGETAIPFAKVEVRDTNQSLVIDPVTTDANGRVVISLMPGNYYLSGSAYGFIFQDTPVTLTTPAGTPDVTLYGAEVKMWISPKDLESVVDRAVVDQLFQDTNSSARDMTLVQSIILQAQAQAESKLLRSWSLEDIHRIAFHDPSVRANAAWIALELCTERRSEFVAADGKGRYWTQYDRAIKFFDSLGKSKEETRGTSAFKKLGTEKASQGANTGAGRRPKQQTGTDIWTFANEPDGRKHGSF